MATLQQQETVETWEKMMACCFPWGFVWYKEGAGSTCCINFLLGCFLGPCCVPQCHACSFVGSPGTMDSPCAIVANNGGCSGGVIMHQPKV